jgi:hypothetical protein
VIGTTVEMRRAVIVTAIMVVEDVNPLVLRYATSWERLKFYYSRWSARRESIRLAKRTAAHTLAKAKTFEQA